MEFNSPLVLNSMSHSFATDIELNIRRENSTSQRAYVLLGSLRKHDVDGSENVI